MDIPTNLREIRITCLVCLASGYRSKPFGLSVENIAMWFSIKVTLELPWGIIGVLCRISGLAGENRNPQEPDS